MDGDPSRQFSAEYLAKLRQDWLSHLQSSLVPVPSAGSPPITAAPAPKPFMAGSQTMPPMSMGPVAPVAPSQVGAAPASISLPSMMYSAPMSGVPSAAAPNPVGSGPSPSAAGQSSYPPAPTASDAYLRKQLDIAGMERELKSLLGTSWS
jgi:hypothetical protein